MRIAVTGGGGFIGSAAIRYADACGHEVWRFDREDGNDIMGDLSVLRGAEAVVHLAGVLGTAELFDDPYKAIEVNVSGALHVIEWCEKNDAAFVGISMPPVFPSVYTATKMCADRLATAWHLFRGVPTSHVVAYNAYGPGQKHGPGHPQKIIPTFAWNAWHGYPVEIWGDGEQTVDLVHVNDIGRMLIDAIEFGGNDDVFDAGTGTAVTVNDVAAYIVNFTGNLSKIVHLPMRDGEVATNIVAKGQGWDKLNWKPTSNWDMLDETINAYMP